MPPTDDTEAREPDAPDPTDAKPHAPLHGHTGGVPSDKALSDRHRQQAVCSVPPCLPPRPPPHTPTHHNTTHTPLCSP
eukprot:scaffold3566_cov119-Isochrysis_galbana.AAC.2